jgi:hypothetical protein
MQLRECARRFTLILLAGALALGTYLPVRAAEPASFKWVPADVAFYATMLRNSEQIEAIAQSKAWAKLMNVPVIKQYMDLAKTEMANNPQMALVHQMLDQPENKELVQLLKDMGSEEIFLVGGESWGDFLELAGILNVAQQFGPLQLLAQGKEQLGATNFNLLKGKAMLAALADNTKLIKIPDILIGFKVPDPKKAENQLKRLEGLVQFVLGFVPHLKDKFKRVKIGTGTFLTQTLDGSLIPWDNIPFDDLDLDKEQVKKVRDAVEKLSLHIHIGVSGDYVLFSLSGSPNLLGKLGGKGEKLGDREELKPLAKYADSKLISVSYASKALRQRSQGNPKEYMDGLVEMAKAGLDKAELDEKQKQKILKDVKELAAQSLKNVPEFGAILGFAFLTDKGQEGYSIDYSKYPGIAKAKPLTLLHHLGGTPLIAGVMRSSVGIDDYDNFVKVLQKVYGHADEIARSKLDGDVKEHYEKVTKAVLPLLKRLDEVTRTLYLPAVADGQVGLVIDAKWKSKQWSKMLPETPMELPLPEIAVLIGVSDADKLVKAMSAYGKLIDDAVDVFRELVPDAPIPEFKFPAPETVKKGTHTLYFYSLPELLGLDERVAPTAGVGPKVAVLTLSHQHAERLLANKPVAFKDLAFTDPQRPLLSASVFHWAGVVDTLVPWAEFAAGHIIAVPEGQEAQAKAMLKEVNAQIKTIAQVLKVYKGTTTATYIEDGKVVTHSVSIVHDLDK